ncbi:MAG: rhodanese-like domain-containing protein [Thermaerobacter sp.]|nr:rhodanese-like domain-containing protein [Thermaerobacter sp.]
MLGGLWGSKVPSVSADELASLLKQEKKPLVLDVRTPGEFAHGHVPGARLVPLGQLGRHLAELPRDHDIVTVCRSGHRALMAARQLVRAGFSVKNLTGGMLTWTGPTTKG